MTLTMTAEEYNGVIKYLLSLPMSRADFPMLEHLYAAVSQKSSAKPARSCVPEWR